MKDRFLAGKAGGEFTKSTSALLIWQALPRDAAWAQLALPVLLLGAVMG